MNAALVTLFTAVSAVAASTVLALSLAEQAQPAAQQQVVKLERVVVVGQRMQVAQLPRVVVEGRRNQQGADLLLASAKACDPAGVVMSC